MTINITTLCTSWGLRIEAIDQGKSNAAEALKAAYSEVAAELRRWPSVDSSCCFPPSSSVYHH
jgi:hypothetical protein